MAALNPASDAFVDRSDGKVARTAFDMKPSLGIFLTWRFFLVSHTRGAFATSSSYSAENLLYYLLL